MISKVVSLLDAFGPTTPELSLGDLARVTGLPVSTTYRLASELVEWGGLERADRSGYRIGMRLWELGALAPRGGTLRDVALPFMQDLYEATHENVHLAVRDGLEALYVDTISGQRIGAHPLPPRRSAAAARDGGRARCSWRTPRRRCCRRSWRAACAGTPRTPWWPRATCAGRWPTCAATGSPTRGRR